MTLNDFKKKMSLFDNNGYSHAYVTCAYCGSWLTTLNVGSAIRHPKYAHNYTLSCHACGQTSSAVYMRGTYSL